MQVDILLSTYNSEIYLPDLIQSIFSQTYTDWRIIIRDDRSKDRTIEIINDLIAKHPGRIVLLENHKGNIGPKKSFEFLLEFSDSEYFMFCDHDDIWLPSKIEITLNKMKEVETIHKDKPVLICTDLVVVDSNLNEVNPSFWKYSGISPDNIFNIYSLAINNPVVGCTVMINRMAKEISLPFSDKAIMHDWWIALKVISAGFTDYVNQSTILYRQHESNAIGSSKISFVLFLLKLKSIGKTFYNNISIYKMLKQANKNVNILLFIFFKIKIILKKYFFFQ